MEKFLGKKDWLAILLFGLFGQFAWTIENMYFNVFMYNTITTDSRALANMIFASAVVATLTTLLMGALTDKLGKRKGFIVLGYILWGLSTLAFGFISVDNVARLFPSLNAVTLAATIVIVMDCVMTFFGSTANDAAFNAWINDVTPTKQRGRVETVLAVMPLVAMLIIFGGFDWLTQQGRWDLFFIIFGVMITLGGVIGAFLIEEHPQVVSHEGNYFSNIWYGFKLRVAKQHPVLYTALCLLAVLGISTQTFMPFFIIYMQKYLALDNYTIPLAVILIVSSVVSVLSGKWIDTFGKLHFLPIATLIEVIGLVGLFASRSLAWIIISGVLTVGGNMVITACINGIVRDFTPKDRSGHFQGVRMFFNVLIPMAIGPYLGSMVIKGSGETYTELGEVKEVPTPMIFMAAALVLVILGFWSVYLKKKWKDEVK